MVVLLGVRVATALTPGLTAAAALEKWDSVHWVAAATSGYPHHLPLADGHLAGSTAAFFPAYPLLVRVVSAVTGLGSFKAALFVSNGTGLVATIALWHLTRALCDTGTADRSSALFCLFPGALAFSMAYSEGTMLALAIPCVWALVARRWLLAGCLAGLATATRPNAVALAACCALVAAHAVWTRREWRSLVAPLLSPAGVIAFVVFLHHQTGRWDAWPRTEREGWGERVNPRSVWIALRAFQHHSWQPTATLILLGALTVAVFLPLLLWSKLPWPLSAYAILVLVPAVASQQISTKPRLVLAAFPLFVGAADRLRPVAYQITVGLMAALTVATTAYLLSSPLTAP